MSKRGGSPAKPARHEGGRYLDLRVAVIVRVMLRVSCGLGIALVVRVPLGDAVDDRVVERVPVGVRVDDAAALRDALRGSDA